MIRTVWRIVAVLALSVVLGVETPVAFAQSSATPTPVTAPDTLTPSSSPTPDLSPTTAASPTPTDTAPAVDPAAPAAPATPTPSPSPTPSPTATPPRIGQPRPDGDYPIPNGHFFTQAAPGQNGNGYRVANEAGIPFLDAFKAQGGVDVARATR